MASIERAKVIEKAKIDPSSVYKHPRDVLADQALSREQKIDILKRWAYDAREIAVAEEENMQSASDKHHIVLEAILECLISLKTYSDQDQSPPTKQG